MQKEKRHNRQKKISHTVHLAKAIPFASIAGTILIPKYSDMEIRALQKPCFRAKFCAE